MPDVPSDVVDKVVRYLYGEAVTVEAEKRVSDALADSETLTDTRTPPDAIFYRFSPTLTGSAASSRSPAAPGESAGPAASSAGRTSAASTWTTT